MANAYFPRKVKTVISNLLRLLFTTSDCNMLNKNATFAQIQADRKTKKN